MKEYKTVGNYSLFKELNTDLVGTNFRAGKIVDGKFNKHLFLTEVHPYLYQNAEVWKRVELLLNGVKKSKISNLYSPDSIIDDKKKYLVYPYLDGMCLENILDDSTKKNIPVNFDLALSIAMGIADLLEAGSSIAVSGKRSFHGFLTPDNIIIDQDGNIWIKNYGIYAYLNTTDEIRKELEFKYGAWLTPEFIRNEKPVPQSDIYHLGYIIYKMVTGNYFSYSKDDNFESKLSNISFLHHIPSSDKNFLDNMILFFNKTLNPDPNKRFSNTREFKEFVSKYFNIEELSSVTFNIAYFMNSLYAEETEKAKIELDEETKYIVPHKPENKGQDDEPDNNIVESLLSGLDEREKSGNKFILIAIIIAVIAVAIVGFTMLNKSKNETKKSTDTSVVAKVAVKDIEIENLRKKLATQQKEMALAKQREDEARKKALEIERQIKEEKDAAKKAALKKEQEKQKKIAEDEKRKADEAKLKEEKLQKEKKAEEEKKKEELRIKEEKKKAEEERKNAIKEGDMVQDVDTKPIPINTEIPRLPRRLRKKIQGDSVQAIISLIINEKGAVKKIKFTKKTGIPELDIELMRIINKWTFKPALKYGKKVSTWFTKVVSIKK